MKFCEDHWDRLRAAINDRGLERFVAQEGSLVAEQMRNTLEVKEVTPVNYEPLSGAMFAIITNVVSLLDRANPAGFVLLYLMQPDGTPEDRVRGYGNEYDGRTWSRCPLCYIGLAHEMTCKDPRCQLPKRNGYDWMIDQAADDARDEAVKLGLM